jgi:hypothetical protein
MRTLIIANRQSTAKDYFEKAGLDEDQEDWYIGLRGELYGMRFDLIKFIEPITMDHKIWKWFEGTLYNRVAPGGEIVWEPQ